MEAKTVVAGPSPSRDGHGLRPGDDFNQRTTWPELLVPAGWQLVHEHNGQGYWRRPGKEGRGWSATTNYADADLFHVFTTNGEPFGEEKSYSKFAAFTLLHHAGDFSAAAKALAAQGAAHACRRQPAGREVPAGSDPEHG